MTMIAIKLCEENFEKILPTCSSRLPAADLQAMIEYYTESDLGPLYFVPMFEHNLEATSHPWGTIPLEHLDQNFTYDHDLIKTQFVEIIPVRD